MPSSEKVIVDTYAWIEYFRGTKEGEKAKEFIDGDHFLLTPTTAVAELGDKYRRQGKKKEWEVRKHFVRLKSDLVNLNYRIADRAGEIKQEMRKKHSNAGLADAIIASHAEAEKAKILTGDRHLIDREETINVSRS